MKDFQFCVQNRCHHTGKKTGGQRQKQRNERFDAVCDGHRGYRGTQGKASING